MSEHSARGGSQADLAAYIDHALLDPHQGSASIRRLCEEARHFNFAGVCVASRWTSLAREHLPTQGSVKLISVVGFPFGAIPAKVKYVEAEFAAAAGANELDVVPDFGALADGDSHKVLEDLAAIAELDLPFKVILDMARLSPQALELLVEISIDAGASCLKTGTGFGPAVQIEQVSQLKALARGRAAIKAAGGIAGLAKAFALIEAGANRLGTSRSVALMDALRQPSPSYLEGT